MARILVFDNDPTNKYGHVDNVGDPVPYAGKGGTPLGGAGAANGLSQSNQDPVRTMPVRTYGQGVEIRYIGWEFFLHPDGLPEDGRIDIRWWQEFYNDRLILTAEQGGHQIVSPRGRNWREIDDNSPWMQETCLVDSGSAGSYGTRQLNVFPIERFMTMRHRHTPPDVGNPRNADSLYFPLAVHAAWTRLGFYVDITDIPDNGSLGALELGTVRLQVFANVGGHDETQYLESNGHLPYAYKIP